MDQPLDHILFFHLALHCINLFLLNTINPLFLKRKKGRKLKANSSPIGDYADFKSQFLLQNFCGKSFETVRGRNRDNSTFKCWIKHYVFSQFTLIVYVCSVEKSSVEPKLVRLS